MRTTCLLIVMLLLSEYPLSAFQDSLHAAPGNCTHFGLFPPTRWDKEVPEPVIYGPTFQVPGMKVRITRAEDGRVEANKELIIRYVWGWHEYPYPESLFGTWSMAYEIVNCTTDETGTVVVPPHKVIPRGWYDG